MRVLVGVGFEGMVSFLMFFFCNSLSCQSNSPRGHVSDMLIRTTEIAGAMFDYVTEDAGGPQKRRVANTSEFLVEMALGCLRSNFQDSFNNLVYIGLLKWNAMIPIPFDQSSRTRFAIIVNQAPV